MAHSFMLALADPSIERRLLMMGYNKEEDEDAVKDAMAYNTRARIEMAMPRTLKSVPRPRPSCVVQLQAYVLPKLKMRTISRKQRCEQHTMFQPVLTAVARAAQVKQDRAADAAHRPPQPKISNARDTEPSVPEQPQEVEQKYASLPLHIHKSARSKSTRSKLTQTDLG